MTVIVILGLLSIMALILATSTASDNSVVSSQRDRDELAYVLESALAHASWQVSQNNTCTDYSNLPNTPFGQNSYLATVTPDSGSPVTITAVGTLANGTTRTVTRSQHPIYQAPTSLILQPGAAGIDAYIWDGAHKRKNFGTATILNIKNDRNILISFDLSSLPAGAIISDARLQLYLESGNSITDAVIDVHRVAREWVEGTYDDVDPPTGGGVTYEEYDGGNDWNTSGGDYDAQIVDSITIPALVLGWYEWTVTNEVSNWVNGATNNGFLLREGLGSGSNVDIEFTSSDGVVAQRPRLTITYRCECGTLCAAASNSPGNLLLVVADPNNLSADEILRRDLIESWGYSVELIDDAAAQVDYDSAAAANDVAYIVQEVVSSQIRDKLRLATIGVVSEEQLLHDDLGFAAGYVPVFTQTDINIVDNSHEITAGLTLGDLQITDSSQQFEYLSSTLSADLTVLAEYPFSSDPILAVLDVGADLVGGGNAAGRRVWLPWGGNTFQFSAVNGNGQTIMQRAIEWASGEANSELLPIAHWKLNEASGTTAMDSVGSNDGTLLNGPTWSTGILGGGLQLDGNNDHILVSDTPNFHLVEGTIQAWINVDTTSGEQYLFHKNGSDRMYVQVKDGELFYETGGATISAALQGNQWHLVTVTFGPAGMRLYIDENLVAGSSNTDGLADNDEDIFIGSDQSGNKAFDGKIDDIRIFDRALTAQEIADFYTASSSGGGSGGSGGTYRDEFSTQGSFAGDDGTLSWSTDWLEIGESNGAGSGDIRVWTDPSQDGLRVRDSDNGGEGAEREANLSSCSSAALSFDYRRLSLDNSSDYVGIYVSGDGGSNWSELDRLQGTATDTSYQSANYDISAYMTGSSRIRFLGSSTLGGTDTVYFDNVEITCF